MLQPLPVVGSIPSDSDTPESLQAARIEGCSAVRVLSKCIEGSGEAYLWRYEPQLQRWWPHGEYVPMRPDASKHGGKFTGRYGLESTGPVYFVLVKSAVPVLSLAASDHWIEGVRI